jgi:hypothetical protein
MITADPAAFYQHNIDTMDASLRVLEQPSLKLQLPGTAPSQGFGVLKFGPPIRQSPCDYRGLNTLSAPPPNVSDSYPYPQGQYTYANPPRPQGLTDTSAQAPPLPAQRKCQQCGKTQDIRNFHRAGPGCGIAGMKHYKSCNHCSEKNSVFHKRRVADAQKLAAQQVPPKQLGAPPQYETMESRPVPEHWKAVGMVHYDGEPYYEAHKPIFRELVPIPTAENVQAFTDHEGATHDDDGVYGGLPLRFDEHVVSASPNQISPAAMHTPIDINALFTSTEIHTDLLRCAALVNPGPDAGPQSRAAYLISQYSLAIRLDKLRHKWKHTSLSFLTWFRKTSYLASAAMGSTPILKDSLTPFAPLAEWFVIYANVTATPVYTNQHGVQSRFELKARKLQLMRTLDQLAFAEETRSREVLVSFLREIQPGVAEEVLRRCLKKVDAEVAVDCRERGCLEGLIFKSRDWRRVGIQYDMSGLA